MKKLVFTTILLFTCALSLSAQVINYEIDPEFNSGNLLVEGMVRPVLVHDDGRILVGGDFWNPTCEICLLNADGSLNLNLGNGSGLKYNFYKQGYLSYGYSGIGPLNLPGENVLDFYFEFSKPMYSGPLPNYVHDAFIDENDNILVAGRFFTDSTLIGTNMSHLGLRHLCMVDSTGAPVPEFPMLWCAQPIVNSALYSIKRLSTGKFIISGFFEEVNGHQTNSIARLNADYTVDTDFVSPLESNVYSIIQHIDSQDRIWIFLEYGILPTNPDTEVFHARLLSDGSVDETFQSPDIKLELDGEFYDSSFSRVYEDSDGTFVMVGQFSHYNDTVRRGVLKIYDNGYIVPEVFENFGADEAVWDNWIAPYGASITSVTPLPDGKLLLGGQFSSFGGEPYSCMVRLQPSGYVNTENAATKNELIIFPNPAKDSFTIKIPDHNTEFLQVEIYDLMGRIIRSSTIHHFDNMVQVDQLLPGTYLVKALNSNGMYSGKLVKQ